MNKCRRFSGGPAKQRELLISSDVQSGSLTRRGAERVMFLPRALKGARAPSPNIGFFKPSLALQRQGRRGGSCAWEPSAVGWNLIFCDFLWRVWGFLLGAFRREDSFHRRAEYENALTLCGLGVQFFIEVFFGYKTKSRGFASASFALLAVIFGCFTVDDVPGTVLCLWREVFGSCHGSLEL